MLSEMNRMAFFQNGKLQELVHVPSETFQAHRTAWAAAGVQSVHSHTRQKVGQVNRNKGANMTTRGGWFFLHCKQWQSVSASVWSSLRQVSAPKHVTAETWAATAATAPCPETPATRLRPEPREAPSEGTPASRSLMCEVSGARTPAASWTFSFYVYFNTEFVDVASTAAGKELFSRQLALLKWVRILCTGFVVSEKLYMALTLNKIVIFLLLCVWFSTNLNVTGYFVSLWHWIPLSNKKNINERKHKINYNMLNGDFKKRLSYQCKLFLFHAILLFVMPCQCSETKKKTKQNIYIKKCRIYV